MKLERADSESKIEDLLYEYGLLEDKNNISNILDKKSSTHDRQISKEAYLTVVSEIMRSFRETKNNIKTHCSKIKNISERKKCKNQNYKKMIEHISNLKGQCIKNKYHQKRCMRKCNTIIKYLQKETRS